MRFKLPSDTVILTVAAIVILAAPVTIMLSVLSDTGKDACPYLVRSGDTRWYAKSVSLPDKQGCLFFVDNKGQNTKICGSYSVTIR